MESYESYNEDWVKVYFTQKERTLCKQYGRMRGEFQRSKGNAHIAEYQNNEWPFSQPDADKLGVIAELLVVKYLGLPTFDSSVWCYYSENKSDYSKPEVAGLVEVRRVNEAYSPLRIYKKDVEDLALNVKVFIPWRAEGGQLAHVPNYGYVQGWVPAARAWENAQHISGNCRMRHTLNAPQTLLGTFQHLLSERAA